MKAVTWHGKRDVRVGEAGAVQWGAGDAKASKLEPDILEVVLRKVGLRAEEAVFGGDSVRDLSSNPLPAGFPP